MTDALRSTTPILLVEDDRVAAEIFSHILKTAGFDVRIAGDAETGLEMAARERPSAILLDLRLPTIDGLEFLRRLRAMATMAGLPVALVTGDYFAEERIVHEVEALGARVRFKPLWEEDLLRLVEEMLGGPSTAA